MVGIIDLLLNAGSNLFSSDEDPVYVNRRGTGSGSPDDIYAGGTSPSGDTSSSESAFADLIGSDEDFANLYNTLQDDPESLYSTINPIDISGSPFADLIMSDNDFADLFYDMAQNPNAGTTTVIPEGIEPETGPLGGTLGPTLRNFFLGSEDDPGILEQILLGKVTEKDGSRSGGAAGILGGLLGGGQDQGFLGSPLVKLLLAKYLSKKDEGPSNIVPIGQQAFAAGGQGLGSMPDYRVFNIQPALMPGVAYANAPPPGMQEGGLTGLSQKIGEGIDNYAIAPYLAEVGFFEDPSFAKYVEGARLYNQNTKNPAILKSVAPFMDDSFKALREGYEAFLESFKEKRGLSSLEDTTETMQAMKHGGVHGAGKDDGPGDITLARLEPGEFVMTRKATENLGARNLYKLMKQAERMG